MTSPFEPPLQLAGTRLELYAVPLEDKGRR